MSGDRGPRVEVFPARRLARRAWFYRVVASNGETLVVSEGFTRRADAWHAARTLVAAVAYRAVPIRDVP